MGVGAFGPAASRAGEKDAPAASLPGGAALLGDAGRAALREAVEARLSALSGAWRMRLLARDLIAALTPAIESLLTEASRHSVALRRVETVRITRGVREYGSCTISRGDDSSCRLAFSGHLFFAGNAATLIDIVAHELLHACLPAREGHGARFHEAMRIVNRALGLNISVYSEGSAIRQSEALYRYKVVCAACGNTFYYLRAGALVRQPSRYRCAKCGKSAFKVYRLAAAED